MFELLFVGAIVAGGVLLAVGLLKLFVIVLLLPLKLAFVLAKGLVGLVIGIPALILTLLVILGTLPVIFVVLLLPLAIVGAAFAGIMRIFFC